VTYSISIIGYKDTSGPDESRELEQAVAEKARELVSELEAISTVSSAGFSGGALGSVNLKGGPAQ
jgi:hypothetical protein